MVSRTHGEHAKHLDTVLSLLQCAGISLNLKNCSVFQPDEAATSSVRIVEGADDLTADPSIAAVRTAVCSALYIIAGQLSRPPKIAGAATT